MPKRNTNPLPGKMPNGQDRDSYTRLCHEFLEDNYQRLYKYAVFRTRGDEDWAHELLHTTITTLLEGWDDVDFTRSPYTYMQIMMKREQARHKTTPRKLFEYQNVVAVDPHSMIFQVYARENQAENDMTFLAQWFPRLCKVLTSTEREHMEWYLDGLSYEEMQRKHHVSRTRIGQILTRARKKLEQAGRVLLQGAPSGGQGP